MDKIPPSGFFFLYFIVGIFLQRITGSLFYIIVIFLLSCLFIKNKYFFLIPGFLFFILLGFYLGKSSIPKFENFKTLKIDRIRGFVEDIEEKEKIREVVFKSENFREKILLFFPKDIPIVVGNYISLENLEIFPLERENIFKFWNNEITLQGRFKRIKILGKKRDFISSLREQVKSFIRKVFSFSPYEEAGFLRAIVLGERGLLTKEIQNLFVSTGTAHILSISGLHVILLIGILTSFFTSKRLKFLLSSFLFFYAFLIGDNPPVWRAVLMYFYLLLSRSLIRVEDSLNSFFVVALISLIFSPLNLFNVSYQLSYLATFGLIIAPSFRGNLFSRYLENIVRTSLWLFFFLLPFNIYFFQRVPLLSLIGNLFTIPIFQFILVLSFLLIPAYFISPLFISLNFIVRALVKFLFRGLQLIIINYKIALALSILILILYFYEGKEKK